MNLPVLLLHVEHNLMWVCSENDDNELESVVVNRKTGEQIPLEIKDWREAYDEFIKCGWTKAYIPDIQIIKDNEIIDTKSFT